MEAEFYTVRQFAFKLGISIHTIYRAIKNGRINVIRVGSSKRSSIRIPHSEFNRLGIIELEDVINNILDKRKSDGR